MKREPIKLKAKAFIDRDVMKNFGSSSYIHPLAPKNKMKLKLSHTWADLSRMVAFGGCV